MAPTTIVPRSTLDQDEVNLCPSPSMKPRANLEAPQSDGPTHTLETWKRCLRPRQPTTTIQASPPSVKKRKRCSEDNLPAVKKGKNRRLQPSKDTTRQTVKGKLKKRKRGQSLSEDSPGSGESIPKRQKRLHPTPPLTEANLRLLEENMSQPNYDKSRNQSNAAAKRGFASIQESCQSTQSSRAYSAKDVCFENALREFHVDFEESDEACVADVKRVVRILEKKRDSPEPDANASKTFHDIRRVVMAKNEAAVTSRLTPLLMPHRDLPDNNAKTKNITYYQDAAWYNWGSLERGVLPVQKPDFCITLKASRFTEAQQQQLRSPYLDKAGIFPVIIVEVKTALQGPQIADRQNAHNALPVLIRDFIIQQKLGRDHDLQRKIRLFTVAHDTLNLWIKGWFYVLREDGKPIWKFQLLKQVPIAIRTEKGFETSRKYMLNLMEHASDEFFRDKRADSADALKVGLSHIIFDPKEWRIISDSQPEASGDIRQDSQYFTQSLTRPGLELLTPSDDGEDHDSADVAPPKRSRNKRNTRRG